MTVRLFVQRSCAYRLYQICSRVSRQTNHIKWFRLVFYSCQCLDSYGSAIGFRMVLTGVDTRAKQCVEVHMRCVSSHAFQTELNLWSFLVPKLAIATNARFYIRFYMTCGEGFDDAQSSYSRYVRSFVVYRTLADQTQKAGTSLQTYTRLLSVESSPSNMLCLFYLTRFRRLSLLCGAIACKFYGTFCSLAFEVRRKLELRWRPILHAPLELVYQQFLILRWGVTLGRSIAVVFVFRLQKDSYDNLDIHKVFMVVNTHFKRCLCIIQLVACSALTYFPSSSLQCFAVIN